MDCGFQQCPCIMACQSVTHKRPKAPFPVTVTQHRKPEKYYPPDQRGQPQGRPFSPVILAPCLITGWMGNRVSGEPTESTCILTALQRETAKEGLEGRSLEYFKVTKDWAVAYMYKARMGSFAGSLIKGGHNSVLGSEKTWDWSMQVCINRVCIIN